MNGGYRNTLFVTGEDGSAKPELKHPSQELALEICEKHNVPLHPDFTYLWHDITTNDFIRLAEFIEEHGSLDEKLSVLSLPRKLSADSGIKILLENMLVLHKVSNDIILILQPLPLLRCLGIGTDLHRNWTDIDAETGLDAVNKVSGLLVRARAPSRIGARMGRPEKIRSKNDVACTTCIVPYR